MLKKIICFGIISSVILSGSFLAAQNDEDEFKPALLTSYEGSVEIKKSGSDTWIAAQEGMHLNPDDNIRTGDNASVELSFLDGTVIKIEENAVMEIKSIIVDLDTDERGFFFNLFRGKFFSNINKDASNKHSKVEIKTPSAVIAVRGTELFIDAADKDTEVAVFTGQAEVTSEGDTVTLKSNKQTSIRKGKRPEPPFRIKEKVLKNRKKFIDLKKRAKIWKKKRLIIRNNWKKLPPEKRLLIKKKLIGDRKENIQDKRTKKKKVINELRKRENKRKKKLKGD